MGVGGREVATSSQLDVPPTPQLYVPKEKKAGGHRATRLNLISDSLTLEKCPHRFATAKRFFCCGIFNVRTPESLARDLGLR